VPVGALLERAMDVPAFADRDRPAVLPCADQRRAAHPGGAGRYPDWWSDGAASSAEQTGQARVTHDRAVALETLCSLPGGPLTSPETAAFTGIHDQILLYDEHTWGASRERYKHDSDQVKQQWAVKRGYVDRAMADLASVEQRWRAGVAAWAKPAKDSVLVWNTLSWLRSDVVSIAAAGLPATFRLRDPGGGSVAVQQDGPGMWSFVARDVPPLGYARFEIEPGDAATKGPAEARYQIEFDEKAGAVRQIRHRRAGGFS